MIKNYLSLLFVLLGLSARSTGMEITQKTATGDITGSLFLPNSTGAVPVALIIPGSGPTDRDGNNNSMKNNSLLSLATELEKSNIASLGMIKEVSVQAGLAAYLSKNYRSKIILTMPRVGSKY